METRAMHPCRVCYTYIEHGVYVFSEQAKLLCLQAKIRKYLYVTVSMDDRLPLNVCNNCCKQIEGIHKFAMMASRNQEKFDKLIKDNCSPADNKISETKGLLHSYLTKRSMDKIEQDTEEVEVRVDPMLFLQYNSDGDLSDNNEEDEHQLELIPVSQANCEERTAMYECPMCLKTFQAEYAMHTHIWSHASRNTRIILNNHNIYTMGGNSMDLHEELEHNNNNIDDSGGIGETETDGGFTCPICNKIISTKGNLKVHLETHRPKGKYGCDICGRVFKTQCNLRRHKEYHSGVQFTCNVCGRVYPTNSTLRAHSITHSDLRPHKCPLCDKTFKRNQDLKFHINQHTGARPYKCPYCPKAFASSGNCFSHRKRMHPLEVERDREKAAKIMRYPSTAKTASAQS